MKKPIEFTNCLKAKRLLKSIKRKNNNWFIVELTKPINEIDNQIMQQLKECLNKIDEKNIRISFKL
jgi:ERCC4-related helicase